jgi:hypothetical protein
VRTAAAADDFEAGVPDPPAEMKLETRDGDLGDAFTLSRRPTGREALFPWLSDGIASNLSRAVAVLSCEPPPDASDAVSRRVPRKGSSRAASKPRASVPSARRGSTRPRDASPRRRLEGYDFDRGDGNGGSRSRGEQERTSDPLAIGFIGVLGARADGDDDNPVPIPAFGGGAAGNGSGFALARTASSAFVVVRGGSFSEAEPSRDERPRRKKSVLTMSLRGGD